MKKPVLLLMIIVSLGCGRPRPGADSYRDDMGRTVRPLPGKGRFVSLAPNVTGLVLRLAGPSVLVGRTKYCPVTGAGRRIPVVGGMLKPDPEKIMRVKPRLVFLSYEGSSPRIAHTLSTLGIPWYVVRIRNVRQLFDSVRRLALVLRTDDGPLLSAMERSLTALGGRLQGRRIFFHIPGGRSVYTFGKSTLLGDLIRRAGGINCGDSFPGSFPRITPEALAGIRIDRLVILAPADSGAAKSARRIWSRLKPALKPLFTDGGGFFRPGPEQLSAFRRLAARL